MALGTTARVTQAGQAPMNAVFFDLVTVVGDSSYQAGGTAGLEAKIQALAGGAGRTVLAVIPQSTGGYHVEYIRSSGKLLVYYGNYDASDGVFIEVPDNTNLSGVTFTLLVISV